MLSLPTCVGTLPTCVGFLPKLQQLMHQESSFFIQIRNSQNFKEVIIIIIRKNQISFKESVRPNAYSRKSEPLDISQSSRQDGWGDNLIGIGMGHLAHATFKHFWIRHGATALGVDNMGPPLIKSLWLGALHGLKLSVSPCISIGLNFTSNGVGLLKLIHI